MTADPVTLDPLPTPTRVAVLLSGGGRTFENLHTERDAGRLPVEFVRVVASRADAGGLEKADRFDVPAVTLPRSDYPSVRSHSAAIFEQLDKDQTDLVVMAGWLHLVAIPDCYRHRVLNIHPSLIPSFCGKGFYGDRVHTAVLQRGVRISGATVHFADPDYDQGPIVMQEAVPVEDDDTPSDLATRVFAAECRIYPEAIRRVIAGGLRIDGRRVLSAN